MTIDPQTTAPFLLMEGICKRFGSIQALDEVRFEVRRGEVMALVGENGAGKSTLVKILAGLYKPDRGRIEIDGEPVDLSSVLKSESARIAVVQQELSLVPTLSAAENVFLGSARQGLLSSPKRLADRAAPHLHTVGLAGIDPLEPVERLSIAERQLIEVARLLARDARVLVFDEPTAALSDAEIDRVERAVRALQAHGRSVIYITHRLSEVFDLASRVTVLRDGRSQEPLATSEIDVEGLIERMLGGSLASLYPERSSGFGDPILVVDELVSGPQAAPVTLTVRAGEILGLAGQVGSGASELLRAISGTAPRPAGDVFVAGSRIPPSRLRDAMAAGVAYCSPERKHDGLFLNRSVLENLSAPSLDRVTDRGWLRTGKERSLGRRIAGMFQIDTKRLRSVAGNLSGGNQQKVALGKWIGPQPQLLMVDEPTRGVDVGARAEIYHHLRDLAESGLAVVVASSDAQEILGLADTIATFFRGRMVRLVDRRETDAAQLTRDVTHPTEVRS